MTELILSSVALIVSVISAIFSFRLQKTDSRRSTREQLNGIIRDLIKLNAENNSLWFVPEEQRDQIHYQKQSSMAQTAASLSRQAVYLAEQEPALVTDVEFMTIAQGLTLVGDQADLRQWAGEIGRFWPPID